ncbi:hypothetical protein GCM10018793_43560 [Streptomyces sulfonofaciens]|uniref:Uncharacterized protein n=1 Tax=Streptomyces sulfonofaciens TaxID=68272 RepID=A0A919GDY5_9ACTN|nr:hypothetical protein GCM10018793_43560 [Streptomyces sulfonofaciens]
MGLRCTVTHYGPDRLLALRDARPRDLYGAVSVLGAVGTQAARQHGDGWRKDLSSPPGPCPMAPPGPQLMAARLTGFTVGHAHTHLRNGPERP